MTWSAINYIHTSTTPICLIEIEPCRFFCTRISSSSPSSPASSCSPGALAGLGFYWEVLGLYCGKTKPCVRKSQPEISKRDRIRGGGGWALDLKILTGVHRMITKSTHVLEKSKKKKLTKIKINQSSSPQYCAPFAPFCQRQPGKRARPGPRPLTLCKWDTALNLVDYWVREQDPGPQTLHIRIPSKSGAG